LLCPSLPCNQIFIFTYAYEQFKPPQNNSNAINSGRIKIESEDFLICDVPGDGQCFFHVLSLAITGNLSQSLVYRSLICSEIYNNIDFYDLNYFVGV
jgi:hypothetical protein